MAEIIVRSINDNFTQEIIAGEAQEHTLKADEPKSLGGENRGPTPYDLLLGALGSCTGITTLMYARKKGWDLKGVRIKLRHDRIHAQDCAECESSEGYVAQLSREITFEGNLEESQRQKLLFIAQHCPVHKTLVHEIRITDALLPASVRAA